MSDLIRLAAAAGASVEQTRSRRASWLYAAAGVPAEGVDAPLLLDDEELLAISWLPESKLLRLLVIREGPWLGANVEAAIASELL